MEPFVLSKTRSEPQLLFLQHWMDKMPGLSAGFTTRNGGAGKAPWQSLNCALHVGDAASDVAENRKRVSAAAGFAFDKWTCAEQTHGSRVRTVSRREAGTGRRSREEAFAETDGLVTDVPGVMLTAFFADCVPLFFVDPDNRAVGLAHAGWKGTAANIPLRTVEAMYESFGTVPEKLFAAIGPSIGACCYEVDERVVEQFDVKRPERKENGRYMLDLKEVNRQFMIRAGIEPKNIELSGYCTSCRNDLFFSHRGENGQTGRMAAWIGWKDEVTR